MPRRRKRGHNGARRNRRPRRQGVELERFSTADLRTWQLQAENLERYYVQLYYHLESLRALNHDRLCDALCSSKPAALTLRNWVRIVDYKYSLQPLSAAGSLAHGGRFNIGNDLDPLKFPAFTALYLAESYETAYEERFGSRLSRDSILQGHELALRHPESFTAVRIVGRVANLFDLRSAGNLKNFVNVIAQFDMPNELKHLADSLRIQGPLLISASSALKANLLAHNWRLYPSQHGIPANPQVLGRLLLDAGFDGIVYPSTKGPRNCVALFPVNFAQSESFVEVADEGPPYAGKLRLDSNTWREIAAPGQ